jgi:agmatine deiminase
VARDRVVTAVERDRRDPNHAPLEENKARLARMRLPDGTRLEIIELPMPEPVLWEGERLPASYANFYVANTVVLLPVFGCAADERACEILGDCFPGRQVVPIDCRDLVLGLGAFHCLTQQVPAVDG